MTLGGLLLAANILVNPADPAALQTPVDALRAPESICEPLWSDENSGTSLADTNDGCTNEGCDEGEAA